MPASALTIHAVAKIAAPLIKDIYEGVKSEYKSALKKWDAASFPRKFAKKLTTIEMVRTIWSPEESIALRSFYYPCKVITAKSDQKSINRIRDLGTENIVIQGIVGQGKSVFMRYLALQEIVNNDDQRLPIFIELRKLSPSTTLLETIKNSLNLYDIAADDNLVNHLASSGKTVLILDGFDELESQIVKKITNEIEDFSIRFPDLQIVVSSRPNNEIQKLSTFRVVEICPLTPMDYLPFLRALGLKVGKANDIISAINNSPSKVSDLIKTPLMLTLVVFVYQSESQIPEELPEFFERLFYTVFTRHDKLKPAFERQHYSGLSDRKLQALFESFCFMSLQLGRNRTLNPIQFSEAFDLAQDYTQGTNCEEVNFKKDITKVSCLMLEEGIGEVTFLHKSIAEYHAAAFIKSCDDRFAERFYSEAASNWQPWSECLSFLKSIDPYRFAKLFAVPNIEKCLPVYKKLANCKDGRSIATVLPKWIKELSVIYKHERSTPDQYFIAMVGTWARSGCMYEEELTQVLPKVAFETAKGTLSSAEIQELRDQGVQVLSPAEDEIQMSFSSIVQFWGISHYHSALNQKINELEQRLIDAKALSDKLSKRALIFDRKPLVKS